MEEEDVVTSSDEESTEEVTWTSEVDETGVESLLLVNDENENVQLVKRLAINSHPNLVTGFIQRYPTTISYWWIEGVKMYVVSVRDEASCDEE